MSTKRLSWSVAVVCLLLSCMCQTSTAEPAWRPLLPEGWLAVVSTGDLNAAEDQFASVLDDLSFDYSSVLTKLKMAVGAEDLAFAPGDVVLGACETADEQLYLFALLPTDDFEQLVASLNGELAGDVGLVTVFGYDLCLTSCGKWAMVAPLANLDVAQAAKQRPVVEVGKPQAADIALELSAEGIGFLTRRAQNTNARDRRQAVRSMIRWPPKVSALDAAFLQNAPLLTELADQFASLRLSLVVSDDGLECQVAGAFSQTPRKPTKQREQTVARLLSVPDDARVASLTGSGDTVTSELLTRLYLAYAQGRPDEVDAPRYHPDLQAPYAEAVLDAMQHVLHFESVNRVPSKPNAPALANHAILLELDDREAFQQATIESFEHWNELVIASQAKMKVVFEPQQVQVDNRKLLTFRVDMAKAVGMESAPEIERLFERLFGPDGDYVWRLIPIGDTCFLCSDLPQADALNLARHTEAQLEQAIDADAQSSPVLSDAWTYKLHAHRLIDWHEKVYQITMGKVIGRPTPKQMPAAPPVVLEARTTDRQTTVLAKIPNSTVQAFGSYLKANRR